MNRTRKQEIRILGIASLLYGLFAFIYQIIETSTNALAILANPCLSVYTTVSRTPLALISSLSLAGQPTSISSLNLGIIVFWVWPCIFLVLGAVAVFISKVG
jgi:hypothetical protein